MLLGLWIITAFIVYSAKTRYAILVIGPFFYFLDYKQKYISKTITC